MITGVDLVQEQLRIAQGDALSLTQDQVQMRGHALECRINAESPEADFRPAPGRITQWQAPQGTGIRVDTHCVPGYQVPPFYDSLLAKLIVAGSSRTASIERMRTALNAFTVCGIDTTIPFLASIMQRSDFAMGQFNTRWLEEVVGSQGDKPT